MFDITLHGNNCYQGFYHYELKHRQCHANLVFSPPHKLICFTICFYSELFLFVYISNPTPGRWCNISKFFSHPKSPKCHSWFSRWNIVISTKCSSLAGCRFDNFPVWFRLLRMHSEVWLNCNWIVLFCKSHDAPVKYPPIDHFVTEMCTRVHISATKWCITGYLSDALWDLCDGSCAVAALLNLRYLPTSKSGRWSQNSMGLGATSHDERPTLDRKERRSSGH